MTAREHRTYADGVEVLWSVDHGVIRVHQITYPDGHVEVLGLPTLGECCDIMPRATWNRVRSHYENEIRPPGPAARQIEATREHWRRSRGQ